MTDEERILRYTAAHRGTLHLEPMGTGELDAFEWAVGEIDRLRAKVWEATRVVGSLQGELIRARFDAHTRPEADPRKAQEAPQGPQDEGDCSRCGANMACSGPYCPMPLR